jgi:hypothetical protein
MGTGLTVSPDRQANHYRLGLNCWLNHIKPANCWHHKATIEPAFLSSLAVHSHKTCVLGIMMNSPLDVKYRLRMPLIAGYLLAKRPSVGSGFEPEKNPDRSWLDQQTGRGFLERGNGLWYDATILEQTSGSCPWRDFGS